MSANNSDNDTYWPVERAEAIKALRSLCSDLDDENTWPDDLHLVDIIEKHIRPRIEFSD